MFKRLLGMIDKMATDKPVLLAFLVFLVATLVVVPISIPVYSKSPTSFFENVLVEAHGFLFDLLIIGWFAVWLNKRAERRLRIRRYQEEIEDFLGWESLEAMHRITGDIRRLNRGGVSAIDLQQAFLQGAYLVDVNLIGANLTGANLTGAKMQHANLTGANLEKAKLELAGMVGTRLRGANLAQANLSGAYLEDAHLEGATLMSANLKGAYVKRTSMAGADLTHTLLQGAYLEHVDLRGATLTHEQLVGVKSLYGVRFDPALEAALRASHPHLLEASPLVADA